MTIQRLAILGAAAPYRTEDAIARAARRLGLVAEVFDALRSTRRWGRLGARQISRRIERFAPDLILCTRHAARLGETRLTRLLAAHRSAFWYFDVVPGSDAVDLARLCDAVYITCAGQLPAWQAKTTAPVRFLPQGVDLDLDQPGTVRTEYRCEVSFVGSGQYPFRWPLLRRIGAHHDLQLRGPGWQSATADLRPAGGEIRGTAFADVVTSADVSLGAHALPEQANDYASASNRMWKIMGAGGAYLGAWVPGLEAFARDREHCRWYRTDDEALAALDELLADSSERRAMAERGRAHACAEHSYDRRLELLLRGEGYPLPPRTSV